MPRKKLWEELQKCHGMSLKNDEIPWEIPPTAYHYQSWGVPREYFFSSWLHVDPEFHGTITSKTAGAWGLSLSNPQKVVGCLPYPTSRGRGDVIKIEHPEFSMGFLLVEVKMKPPDIFGGYRHQTTQIFVGCWPYSTSRGRGDVIKIKHPRKTRGIWPELEIYRLNHCPTPEKPIVHVSNYQKH